MFVDDKCKKISAVKKTKKVQKEETKQRATGNQGVT